MKVNGAEVITLQAENIPEALVNFAQTHKVRHAVFGKTRRSPQVRLNPRAPDSLYTESLRAMPAQWTL